MLHFIKTVASRLGVDKSIFFTSLGRLIQAGGGIISIFFIAKYLTGVEQGFYYTFGSLVAIQIFFELGLNGIITQYVAHEVSNLYWVTPVKLQGDDKFCSRLASLFHFCIKWYVCFAALLFVTLLVVGFIFFSRYGNHDQVVWRFPWILLITGTAFNLLLAPVLAYLEGLGLVATVAKMRLYQQIVSLLIVWLGLLCGAKLYVLALSLLGGLLLILIYILNSNIKRILLNIWCVPVNERVDYRREIFPYQWKIALSWISGYFIFQLFNPVLFATEGATVAGQMGMTLVALNGIQSLSLSWMTTKVPLYSGLIAQKQYSRLDSIFKRTFRQSALMNISALLFMLITIYLIRRFHIMVGGLDLGNRFLGFLPMILMMVPLFINQLVSSWAIYLRCHKREPFLYNSIIGGVLCCLSTIFLGKYYGVVGITGGYCFITIALSLWSYWIFRTKKRVWHGK